MQGRMQQKLPCREWALFRLRGALMPNIHEDPAMHNQLHSDVAPQRLMSLGPTSMRACFIPQHYITTLLVLIWHLFTPVYILRCGILPSPTADLRDMLLEVTLSLIQSLGGYLRGLIIPFLTASADTRRLGRYRRSLDKLEKLRAASCLKNISVSVQ